MSEVFGPEEFPPRGNIFKETGHPVRSAVHKLEIPAVVCFFALFTRKLQGGNNAKRSFCIDRPAQFLGLILTCKILSLGSEKTLLEFSRAAIS